MFNQLRKPLQPLINLIAAPFMWVHPNVLSLFSFVIAAPGFYFYAKGDSLLGSLFILGAMFDSIDGAVAKKTGKTTKFGGVLDATLDRVFDGLVLFFIGVGGLVDWAWLFLAFIAFVTVSYIKAKTEAVSSELNVGTNRFPVGIAQRGERIAIIFLASILNYFITPDKNEMLAGAIIILLIMALITVVWRGLLTKKEIG